MTPLNKASLSIDYALQRAVCRRPPRRRLRYTSSSAGGLPSSSFPSIVTGAAMLFDAQAHYDVPGWRFAVNASNLADRTYVARCTGAFGCVYGQERQGRATVTRRL